MKARALGRGGLGRRSPRLNALENKVGAGGWTLIELMISVAVVGVIMSVVALIIYVGIRSWRLQSDRLGMASDARTAAEIMTTQLRMGSINSVAISPVTVGGNTLAFGELSFNRYDFTGTTWDTRFYMEQSGLSSPAHLVYSYPVFDAATTTTIRQTAMIASNVSSLYFSYPDIRNPAKVEINLSLSRPSWQARVLTQQVREVVEIRNP